MLSVENNVFDETEEKQVVVFNMTDGNHFFMARGLEGEQVKVKLGLFILLLKTNFCLPFEKWSKVEVGYLDEDVKNLEVGNLYVIYPKEGIPYPDLPGYFYIPGFELNAINKAGHVYRTLRQSFYTKKATISGGYPCSLLDVTIGDERRYIHRLLGIVFKEPPRDYPKLQVDHNDGDKTNFELNNLFWVTRSVNCKKALYDQDLRNDNHEIEVLDMKFNIVLSYTSKAEFARFLGKDPWGISLVMKNPRSVYKDRFVLKLKTDPRSFKDITDLKVKVNQKVKTKNILTGEEVIYDTKLIASKKTGVGLSFIKTAVKEYNPRMVSKNLQFKAEDDETPWGELNEWELECARRGLRSDAPVYELYDQVTGTTHVFYGAPEVVAYAGANPRTVINCARDGKVLHGRYTLKKLTR